MEKNEAVRRLQTCEYRLGEFLGGTKLPAYRVDEIYEVIRELKVIRESLCVGFAEQAAAPPVAELITLVGAV